MNPVTITFNEASMFHKDEPVMEVNNVSYDGVPKITKHKTFNEFVKNQVKSFWDELYEDDNTVSMHDAYGEYLDFHGDGIGLHQVFY